MASYLQQYQDLMNNYTQGAGSQSFQDQLEKALGERTNYNKDLIEQQNALQSQMYNMPQQARAEYTQSNITNPLAQEALIASQRQNVQSQLGSVVDLLNARKQNYSNILSQAVGRENQAQEQIRLSAENAWRLYQDQLARQERARQAGANAQALQMQKAYLESLMGTDGDTGDGDTYTAVHRHGGSDYPNSTATTMQGKIMNAVGDLVGLSGETGTNISKDLAGKAARNWGNALDIAQKYAPFGQTQLANSYYDWLRQNVVNPVGNYSGYSTSLGRSASGASGGSMFY